MADPVDTLTGKLLAAQAENARLRRLVWAQADVIKAVRSLRRGVWPALHEVFDALDALDRG